MDMGTVVVTEPSGSHGTTTQQVVVSLDRVGSVREGLNGGNVQPILLTAREIYIPEVLVRDAHLLRQNIGVKGDKGEQGIPGLDGDRNYYHDQMIAAAVWIIPHNLGKYPSVTVIDSSGSNCEGHISYNSPNQVTLTFSSAFAGYAYLN